MELLNGIPDPANQNEPLGKWKLTRLL